MITLYQGQPVDLKAVLVYMEEPDAGKKETEKSEPEIGKEQSGSLLSVKRVVEDGRLVIQVGLGKKEQLTLLKAKRVGAKAVKKLIEDGAEKGLIDISTIFSQEISQQPVDSSDAGAASAEDETHAAVDSMSVLKAIMEGAALALYQPKSWKKDYKEKTREIYIDVDVSQNADMETVLAEVNTVTKAVCEARDLVNEPAIFLTPQVMASTVREKAEATRLEVEVLQRDEIAKLGMGAFLAVGDSSANPPALIVLRYTGNPDSDTRLGYIGKGVTYDTGGYSLKPAGSMKTMKSDMGGGAAVFGAMLALAETQAKVNVTAVIPAAENRISGGSYLPGDIITSMSGMTIEIGNTDAEGRLLLADGITYAIEKEKVTHLVDIATLTGAVVTMFGSTTAGAMTNDEKFYETFEQAAKQSAEQYWRLPDFEEYRDMIKTPLADMQNISKGGCGTITAGLFLARFHQNLPWIHLDIAGTAFTEKPLWEFLASGATGAGVTSLYQLALEFADK